MKSRTQKSARNMAVGLVSQVFTLLLSFVTRTFFIKLLTAEYLGINGLFSNVLTVLSFAELGIGSAMTYAMYKPVKENDHKLINQLMLFYKKAYTAIAITVGIIGLILSFFLGYIVAEPPKIPESLQVIFWLYIINNMASYLLTYKKSILIAYQEDYIISGVQQITSVVQQLLQIILLWLTRQYLIYLLIQISCTIANNVAISIIVRKRYPWLSEKDQDELPPEVSQEIHKNIKALSVSKIAGVISNGSDNIIISKFVGLSAVGLASNYTMIINALNGILWTGLSSMTSSFGNFNVDSSVEQKRKLFDELFLCSYWLYGFLTIGVATLINPFIELWVGNEYVLPMEVVLALIFITYVSGANFPLYTYQTTLGMFDKMQYPYLAFGICNIILSIILGIKWGLFGIYIATSITRLCTSEAAGGYYVFRYGLYLSPLYYVKKYLGALLLLLINGLITNFFISWVPFFGIPGFAVKVVVCTIACNGLYLLFFFKTNAFKGLAARMLSLIKIGRK